MAPKKNRRTLNFCVAFFREKAHSHTIARHEAEREIETLLTMKKIALNNTEKTRYSLIQLAPLKVIGHYATKEGAEKARGTKTLVTK